MSFQIVISNKLKSFLSKLKKKDKATFVAVEKKILQISYFDVVSIQHFKNLKGGMSLLKRVHIGSFVLTFRVKGDTIVFESLTHHKGAYRR